MLLNLKAAICLLDTVIEIEMRMFVISLSQDKNVEAQFLSLVLEILSGLQR